MGGSASGIPRERCSAASLRCAFVQHCFIRRWAALGHLNADYRQRAVDELCTSREVRLRSQDSDYSRPVDRAARRALTVYGGALQSSLAVALRLSRGSLGVRWWWLGTFGKPRRCLPTIPRDAPAPPGAGREAVAGVAPA